MPHRSLAPTLRHRARWPLLLAAAGLGWSVVLAAWIAGGTDLLARSLALCAQGDAGGCLYAERAYAEGRGVRRDRALAAEYGARYLVALERECDAGRGSSCYSLGGHYERGTGYLRVAQDLGRARELYLRACAAGDGTGCTAARRVGNEGP